MQALSVVLWDGSPLPENEIDVIVRSSDADMFSAFYSEGELGKARVVYKLTPNGDSYADHLVSYFALLASDENPISPNISHPKEVMLWAALLTSIQNWDAHGAKNILFSLRSINNPFYTELKRVCGIFNDYIDLVMTPLADLGLRHMDTLESATGAWWESAIHARTSISDFITKRTLSNEFKTKIEASLINSAKDNLRSLNPLSGGTIDNRIYAISALMGRYADLAIKRGQPTFGFIMTHRALENFLNHLGVKQGEIIPSDHKLVYRGTSEEVYLKQTEQVLFRSGILESNVARQEFIKWLNRLRNSCFIAHGGGFVSNLTATNALNRVKQQIKSISGNNRWTMSLDSYLVPPCISISDLYTSVRDIDGFFKKTTG